MLLGCLQRFLSGSFLCCCIQESIMLRTFFTCIVDQHADVYQNLFKQKHKECRVLLGGQVHTKDYLAVNTTPINSLKRPWCSCKIRGECLTLPFYFCWSSFNTAIYSLLITALSLCMVPIGKDNGV